MTESAETMRDARAELLAAPGRLTDLPSRFAPVDGRTRSAAVLMLFGRLDSLPADSTDAPVAADLDVLLQRRSATLSSHAGQVSFPGGARDAGDRDAVATALREAEEETGLDPSGVDVLATLPELPIMPSRYLVTPVLAWWRTPSRVAAVDHAETVDVFRVPVAELLAPENRYTSTLQREGREFRGPAFDIDGIIVWGFTAMVLDGLFDATGWTIPWDPSVERPVQP
ncbi:NUDIX hydrolase [Microbacterium sp. NPDC058345]|uniref:NUDIX hydrolase n=1 Tax=Microbacterium sp. NPDC058345 TaxID=3346455 RepID=UPI00364A3E84